MLTLGVEFSTQSVKTVLLDMTSGQVVHKAKFDYDDTFPKYETCGGVLVHEDPQIRHTSPFMMVEAIDVLFRMLKTQGVDLARIGAIKIDGMQHCTVYTKGEFPEKLARMTPSASLLEQLQDAISRSTSPIWEDRSPVKETAFLTRRLESEGGIVRVTGNRAELRFPAAQIMKWAKQSPREYRDTRYIQILSAFLTSILVGKPVPVDTGDGWGTNLNHTNIELPGWNSTALAAIDAYLESAGVPSAIEKKIGTMTHYDEPAGVIHPYFIKKYGLSEGTQVLTGTGDNPATLLGCGGTIVISLGSSYTVCGVMREVQPSPTGEYNIFGYTQGNAMALSVFTNGGKVHQQFLRRYLVPDREREITASDWRNYVEAAGNSSLREDEKLMLPYLFDESVPLRERGIVRDQFKEDDMRVNIRSLHLSQVLSLRLHSRHLQNVESLCVVAGGAQNRFLRQLIADIFQARSYSIRHAGYAAPLGCAISCARHLLGISYEEAAKKFVQRDEGTMLNPLAAGREATASLLQRYQELEERVQTK